MFSFWPPRGPVVASSWPRRGLVVAPSWPRRGLLVASSWPRRVASSWPRRGRSWWGSPQSGPKQARFQGSVDEESTVLGHPPKPGKPSSWRRGLVVASSWPPRGRRRGLLVASSWPRRGLVVASPGGGSPQSGPKQHRIQRSVDEESTVLGHPPKPGKPSSWRRGPVVASPWPRRGLVVASSWPRRGLVVASSWPRRGPVVASSWPRRGPVGVF